MNIFEFAIEKEQFSEDYYRQLAERTTNEGLRGIFKMLAGEEAKHQRVVKRMEERTGGDIVTETDVLANAREVFNKMRAAADRFDLDIGEVALYKKGQKIEEEARDFYLEKAEEVENPRHKKIFSKLAEEEKKHYYLLDNIIEFVSRPEHWLENAEFFHPEEY